MNLYNYIKHDFVKQKFMESCLFINTIEDAESLARKISPWEHYNIIFGTTAIKNYFFSKLKIYFNDYHIINCNSSVSRLKEELGSKYDRLMIYDNIDNCVDLDILKEINNPGIFVC